MTSWHSYPKLFALGHGAIKDLLLDEVVVQEKIDGSQFSFGLIDGVLRCRSKGKEIDLDHPEKMFKKAIEVVRSVADTLTPGWTYRGEYLEKPKHNTLAYARTPKNHVMIFDINTGHEQYLDHEAMLAEATRLGFEVVPLIFKGRLESLDQFSATMDRISVLGGAKAEGLVIKNHKRFGTDGKALMGKYVTEAFKEVHGKDWKDRHPGQTDVAEVLGSKYRTPARWAKAVQHLKERGELTESPKDIGALMAEVKADVLAECGDEIKEALLKWAWQKISGKTVQGLPQWYKDELVKKQFEAA